MKRVYTIATKAIYYFDVLDQKNIDVISIIPSQKRNSHRYDNVNASFRAYLNILY